MIFVTIGTSEPFDRLLEPLRALDGEELVVQCGESGIRLENATMISFVGFDELVELIRRSRAVVAHAGVGTILVALRNGRKPFVVPRRADHGEAVDDHQLELARRLDERGLVTFVEDPADLPAVLAAANGSGTVEEPHADPRLVAELRGYLETAVARRGRTS
jgi:UDP-N-acetylglucosamine--N-acetylmuramyl-(pentapeptide) pyrophosphoryl-undecaprenol N-acetylglucosamine transferase